MNCIGFQKTLSIPWWKTNNKILEFQIIYIILGSLRVGSQYKYTCFVELALNELTLTHQLSNSNSLLNLLFVQSKWILSRWLSKSTNLLKNPFSVKLIQALIDLPKPLFVHRLCNFHRYTELFLRLLVPSELCW